jgi:hypothetical protein
VSIRLWHARKTDSFASGVEMGGCSKEELATILCFPWFYYVANAVLGKPKAGEFETLEV